MSKAVDDILAFLRSEDLTDEGQAELIQRLRNGEGDNHPPLGRWSVYRDEGEEPARPVELVAGEGEGLEVTFYHGRDDGKPVIQIDGSGDFRINVNDAPVWDQSTETEYTMPEGLRPASKDPKWGVWVGRIRDSDGSETYVAASEQALYATMRSEYSRVEWREESNHEWLKRVADAGAMVWANYYLVEGG